MSQDSNYSRYSGEKYQTTTKHYPRRRFISVFAHDSEERAKRRSRDGHASEIQPARQRPTTRSFSISNDPFVTRMDTYLRGVATNNDDDKRATTSLPPPPLPPGVYARVPLKLLTRVKRAHGELKPRDIKAKRYPRLGPLTVILYGSTWAALPECEGTEPRNFY